MLVNRLILMAERHRRNVEEQQGTRRAIGPHAIGFFYADDLAMSGTLAVVAATRLFFDSAETADLLVVLDTLIARASEHPAGTFDPLVHACNRAEPMSPTSQLLGVGVTTVDNPSHDASASAAYASLGMDRPYRAAVRMLDGTDILLRCDSGFLAPVDVRATQSLNVNGRHTRHWEWLTHAVLQSLDNRVTDTLARLSILLDLAEGGPPNISPDLAATTPRTASHRAVRRTVRLGARRSG
jgi:hypothetical protein